VDDVGGGVVEAPPSELSSPGLRRTKRTTRTTTEATGIAKRVHGFIGGGYRSFLGKLCEVMERARSGRLSATVERRFGLDIIFDFVRFGIIFGILGTAPIVTWLAVAWLVTDRRRASSRSDAS
jgi:hypothetical protein